MSEFEAIPVSLALTLSSDPDDLVVQKVHVLLQLSLLVLHILEAVCQGLDLSLVLTAGRRGETTHTHTLTVLYERFL